MEFEIANAKAPRAGLVDRFLKRDYLPVDAKSAALLWTLSEHALQEGDRASAERIWNYLVQKGSGSMPEVRFAKARLDKRRTELEDLWKE
jgi:hypothetical protein